MGLIKKGRKTAIQHSSPCSLGDNEGTEDTEETWAKSPLQADCRKWSVDEVASWLTWKFDFGGQYVQSFVENEMTGEMILLLTDDDMIDLGVVDAIHQRALLAEIGELGEKVCLGSRSMSPPLPVSQLPTKRKRLVKPPSPRRTRSQTRPRTRSQTRSQSRTPTQSRSFRKPKSKQKKPKRRSAKKGSSKENLREKSKQKLEIQKPPPSTSLQEKGPRNIHVIGLADIHTALCSESRQKSAAQKPKKRGRPRKVIKSESSPDMDMDDIGANSENKLRGGLRGSGAAGTGGYGLEMSSKRRKSNLGTPSTQTDGSAQNLSKKYSRSDFDRTSDSSEASLFKLEKLDPPSTLEKLGRSFASVNLDQSAAGLEPEIVDTTPRDLNLSFDLEPQEAQVVPKPTSLSGESYVPGPPKQTPNPPFKPSELACDHTPPSDASSTSTLEVIQSKLPLMAAPSPRPQKSREMKLPREYYPVPPGPHTPSSSDRRLCSALKRSQPSPARPAQKMLKWDENIPENSGQWSVQWRQRKNKEKKKGQDKLQMCSLLKSPQKQIHVQPDDMQVLAVPVLKASNRAFKMVGLGRQQSPSRAKMLFSPLKSPRRGSVSTVDRQAAVSRKQTILPPFSPSLRQSSSRGGRPLKPPLSPQALRFSPSSNKRSKRLYNYVLDACSGGSHASQLVESKSDSEEKCDPTGDTPKDTEISSNGSPNELVADSITHYSENAALSQNKSISSGGLNSHCSNSKPTSRSQQLPGSVNSQPPFNTILDLAPASWGPHSASQSKLRHLSPPDHMDDLRENKDPNTFSQHLDVIPKNRAVQGLTKREPGISFTQRSFTAPQLPNDDILVFVKGANTHAFAVTLSRSDELGSFVAKSRKNLQLPDGLFLCFGNGVRVSSPGQLFTGPIYHFLSKEELDVAWGVS